MLKKLLGKALGSAARELPKVDSAAWRDNPDWLRALVEFFPIGKKQRYFPEFQKDIVLDTVIVAYCVNGAYLYSADAIERDAEGYPSFFHTGKKGEGTKAAKIDTIQLLVPDTSELELTLDYERRALIGRGRQFVKGNNITLISSSAGEGQTTVDTEVEKRVVLKDGPYAHSKLILLTPYLNSLVVTDQRKKPRAKISVPVMLSVKGAPLSGPCTIVDISDGAVRIRDGAAPMPEMHKDDDVLLVINLPEAEREYTIKGSVMRRFTGIRVIRLDSLESDGKFIRFGPLDHLELKAGLLNYGS